ncbi:MAG: Inosine-5'-monophosphate dehydrogenase / CBS domain, partial [uncultured Chloroflexi bacterium]
AGRNRRARAVQGQAGRPGVPARRWPASRHALRRRAHHPGDAAQGAVHPHQRRLPARVAPARHHHHQRSAELRAVQQAAL